jgi:hypothetical protein
MRRLGADITEPGRIHVRHQPFDVNGGVEVVFYVVGYGEPRPIHRSFAPTYEEAYHKGAGEIRDMAGEHGIPTGGADDYRVLRAMTGRRKIVDGPEVRSTTYGR